jgi:adenosine deaminase
VDLGGNPTKQDFQMFAPLFSKARSAGLKVTLHCGEVPSGVTEDENGGETNAMDDDAKMISRQGMITRFNEAVAVLDFKPDRLGHAMLLPSNLQERIVQEKIPVETCPTSNVMTLELTKKVAACHGPSFDDADECYDDANENGGGGEENGNRDNNGQGNLVAGLRHHPTLKKWLQQEHPLCISTDDPGVFRTSLTQELLLVAKTFHIAKERLAQRVVDGMQYAFCDNDTKSRIRKHMREQLNQLNGQQQPQI